MKRVHRPVRGPSIPASSRPSVEHSVTTPGAPAQLSLVVDDMAVMAAGTEADAYRTALQQKARAIVSKKK